MSTLNFGVAREIITPPLGSQLFGYNDTTFATSLHDDLTATAFYFESNGVKSVMITATVCSINTVLFNKIRNLIEQKTGIPSKNVILCATHTHSGPNVAGMVGWGDVDEKYAESIFIPQITKAVQRAVASPVPVTVSIAVGNSDVGINRRELKIDNKINLGQNPWGPYDPKMTILSFKNKGKTVGNIIHYGCHGTSAGNNTEITRDWSGIMTDRIEEISGAITAFVNGPEGDVGPRLSNGKTVGNITYVEELGKKAADDAERIYKTLSSYDDATASVKSQIVKLPLLPRISLEEAKAGARKYANNFINWEGQFRNYYNRIVSSYENDETDQDTFDFEQIAITVGPVSFVAFPFELFTVIGMRIANEVSSTKVLGLSNANGLVGYFATEDQICRGGYEIRMFETTNVQRYVKNADWHMATQTISLFNDKENK